MGAGAGGWQDLPRRDPLVEGRDQIADAAGTLPPPAEADIGGSFVACSPRLEGAYRDAEVLGGLWFLDQHGTLFAVEYHTTTYRCLLLPSILASSRGKSKIGEKKTWRGP